jgi:hypothetical protein
MNEREEIESVTVGIPTLPSAQNRTNPVPPTISL